jgi:Leucine-rich repeat (LRR) protein
LHLNNLTSIPDLRNVKDTLQVVSVYQNKIAVVREEDIDYLTNLQTIRLSGNPIISLTDALVRLP